MYTSLAVIGLPVHPKIFLRGNRSGGHRCVQLLYHEARARPLSIKGGEFSITNMQDGYCITASMKFIIYKPYNSDYNLFHTLLTVLSKSKDSSTASNTLFHESFGGLPISLKRIVPPRVF